MFRDLRIVGLASGTSHIPTVGAFFNPSAVLEKIQNLRHPYLKTILSGFAWATGGRQHNFFEGAREPTVRIPCR